MCFAGMSRRLSCLPERTEVVTPIPHDELHGAKEWG